LLLEGFEHPEYSNFAGFLRQFGHKLPCYTNRERGKQHTESAKIVDKNGKTRNLGGLAKHGSRSNTGFMPYIDQKSGKHQKIISSLLFPYKQQSQERKTRDSKPGSVLWLQKQHNQSGDHLSRRSVA